MITGQLEQQPLAQVLQQLYASRFTGELCINTRGGLVQVYLREGYPVYVNLTEPADLLGKLLVEMRVLSDSAHRHAVALGQKPGQRFGEVLLQHGLCDENQLKQGLRAQVRRKLHRLFALTAGGFVAIPGEHGRGIQGGESLRTHPYRIIYQAARMFPLERLRALLLPLSGQSVRLRAGGSSSHSSQKDENLAARYGFGAEEGYLVMLLGRGFFSLHELQEVSGFFPPTVVPSVVYALLSTEALEVAPEGSQPMGRDLITDLPPPPKPERPPLELKPAAPEPPKAEARPEVKPELKLEAKPEAKAESKPELKLESKAESKVELKLESKPELKLESKPEVKAVAKPESRTDLKAMSRADSKPGVRSPTGSNPAIQIPGGKGATPSSPALKALQAMTQKSAQRTGQRPVSFEEQALMRAEIENKAKVVQDETLFAVLGVPESADEAAVKIAYLQAAKKYHPDRIGAMGLQALRDQAEKIFRRVNEAHQVLTDPERRAEYVAELRSREASGDKLAKEKELAVKAVNAELAFSRGMVFMRKRDFTGAAREFQEAVNLNPNEGEHVAYLTWCRFCVGLTPAAEAIKEMARAIKMEGKVGRLHYFMGVLLKQEGAEDKAYQAFQKARELDPRLEEAQSEIRLIETRRAKGITSEKKGGAPDEKGGEKKKMSFLDRLRQPIGKK